jgi:hypothetical protein
MADRKARFTILSKFESLCKRGGISIPPINKYNEQWAADALLESFDFDQILSAMEYYLRVNPRPSWKGFANNADKVLRSIQDQQQDMIFRKQMREKAKEWLSES